MYQVEHRAKLLNKHLGLTYGVMAQEIGVTKKELLGWFKDKDQIPEEKISLLCEYFKLTEDELFEEIKLQVEYSFISNLSNNLNRIVKEHGQHGDTSELLEGIGGLQEELKVFLIKQQEEMKIK